LLVLLVRRRFVHDVHVQASQKLADGITQNGIVAAHEIDRHRPRHICND
jgi:hypothetical protein